MITGKRKLPESNMSNNKEIINLENNNEILNKIKEGLDKKNLIRIPNIEYEKYIGYLNYNDFNIPVNTIGINRVINTDVVNNRVDENISYYNKNKKFCDFGNAILSLNLDNPIELNIIDGQHRFSTLEKIKNIINDDNQEQIKYNINKEAFKKTELNIAVTIMIFKDINESRNYLKHFQHQYVGDNRLFSFNELFKREQLEKLINIFRNLYKNRFIKYDQDLKNQIKYLKSFKEVNKPNLSDGIIADFLKNEDIKINIFNSPNINEEIVKTISLFIKDNLNLKDSQLKSLSTKYENDECYYGYIRCNFESSIEERFLIKKINEKFVI
jgi:hypothetical protein